MIKLKMPLVQKVLDALILTGLHMTRCVFRIERCVLQKLCYHETDKYMPDRCIKCGKIIPNYLLSSR